MTVDSSQFTDSQRRRSEALRLVHSLFPMLPAKQARQFAVWITTGRWVEGDES